MLQLLWSRSMAGERPGVLLGKDCILLNYTAIRGKQKGARLICFDLEGRELWSQSGGNGLLTLGEDHFLVNMPEGEPVVVSSGGRIVHRSLASGIEQVARHGDLLMLADKRHVWATDLELNPFWRLTWPGSSRPAIGCFVDGAFYWAEANELKRCTWEGQCETICLLPEALIAQAMDRYEQTTGRSALSGWYTRTGDTDIKAFQRGDRPWVLYWRLSFDEKGQQFFLSNCTGPHLIVCLDRSGQPRWCEYLCCGCCGGVPCRLPNGLYVASSGCGGILSWLDGDGHVFFQSRPHEGVGLETAYSNELHILPDGRVLVRGGLGIVAYSSKGERLWMLKGSYMRFRCDPARGVLVGCYWQSEKPNNRSKTYLECIGGL